MKKNTNFVLDHDFTGSFPDNSLIIAVISKEDVVSCATGVMVDRLMKLSDHKENILKGKNSLAIVFSGWDDDPRELFEIHEVRKYFAMLNSQWSYWFHFCEKFSTTLGVVLSLLAKIERSTVNGVTSAHFVDPKEIGKLIHALFDSQNILYETHGIDESINMQISKEVSDCLNKFLQ